MTLIKVVRSKEHYYEEENGGTTRYHFSCGPYYDPKNMSFGPLRLFNEYIIPPKGGSEFQFIDNIEIIGYIIDGELEHRDDLGNRSIMSSGYFYNISSGRGIVYSQKNYSEVNPIKILEMWIFPARKGLTPSFRKQKFSTEGNLNKIIQIFTINESSNQLSTSSQVAEIYFSKLCPGQEIRYNTKFERGNYLFVVNGKIIVNQNFSMNSGDAAQISYSPIQSLLNIKNVDSEASEIIMIDIPLITPLRSKKEQKKEKSSK